MGRDLYIVPQVSILNSLSQAPAGTLSRIGADFLEIATADFDIAIHELFTLNGALFPISEFVARFGPAKGYVFGNLSEDEAKQLQAIEETACPRETFWLKRLETLEPLAFPYAASPAAHESLQQRELEMPVPDDILEFLRRQGDASNIAHRLVACFGAFLGRVADTRQFDIGFGSPATRRAGHWIRNLLFLDCPPAIHPRRCDEPPGLAFDLGTVD